MACLYSASASLRIVLLPDDVLLWASIEPYFDLRYRTSSLAPVGSGLRLTSRSSSPDRLIPLLRTAPSMPDLFDQIGLLLPIVVLDDKWLALIKVKQMRRQFPLYGTALQEEDYHEPPAHYFGVPARCVRSADPLAAAATAALAADGPTVIEAVVDSDHHVDTIYD
jgi:hypothetical protein